MLESVSNFEQANKQQKMCIEHVYTFIPSFHLYVRAIFVGFDENNAFMFFEYKSFLYTTINSRQEKESEYELEHKQMCRVVWSEQ